METWAHRHGFGTKELLAFMSACMVGTMVMVGYDQDFANATFDRMKINFFNKRSVKSVNELTDDGED